MGQFQNKKTSSGDRVRNGQKNANKDNTQFDFNSSLTKGYPCTLKFCGAHLIQKDDGRQGMDHNPV